MFMTCFREDSITYNISQGNDADALSLIKKVYASHENPEEILASLKGKSEKGSSGVSLSEATCHRKYAMSTWVAFALCFFQQQTGLDGIMIYSNTIFAQMAEKGAISITAKQGSYMVGCVNWLGAILAPIPLSFFGRKTLLFWGQIAMGISLVMTGIFQQLDMSIPIIISLCIFITSFQFSQGPIAWMYAAEVAVDTALGLCILALFLSLLEKAITMEFMVHSRMGPHGMFYLLGGITLVGAVFVAIFIKETKGLSDYEKKTLYMPEEFKTGASTADRAIEDSIAKNKEMLSDDSPKEIKPEGKEIELTKKLEFKDPPVLNEAQIAPEPAV